MNEKHAARVNNQSDKPNKILQLLEILKETTEAIQAIEKQIEFGSFRIDFRNHDVKGSAYTAASKAVQESLQKSLKGLYLELKSVNDELIKLKGH